MESWMSARIEVMNGPEYIDKVIQTNDEKLKAQIIFDLLKLIRKYEAKGCHIVR